MISLVGRAEALAAVALVIGARREPVIALRQLAAEDPALAVLTTVADRCAAGISLPQALADCRLVKPQEAAQLAHATPDILAEELTRLAQRTAAPPFGEVLAKWLPVWVIVVASLPSLLIGGVVAVVTGTFYVSVWDSLGFAGPHARVPGTFWLVQLVGILISAAMAAVLWSLVRHSFALCHISIFSRNLDRASLLDNLLRRVRAGGEWQRTFRRWRWMSGDARAVRAALDASGGDPAAALMSLGIVPRRNDGGPDWECALAEAERNRRREADDLTPWLIALLVMAGMGGFMTWGVNILVRDEIHWVPFLLAQPSLDGLVRLLAQTLGIVIAVVVMANVRFATAWTIHSLSGAARDWPWVADRVARSLDRREDLAVVLRGLRFAVHRPMRRRIDRALASDEARPAARLAEAGMIPASLAPLLVSALDADLPTLLRSSAEDREGHGMQGAVEQAKPMMVMLCFTAAMAGYLAVGVIPKFATMFNAQSLDGFSPIQRLMGWALSWSLATIAIASLAVAVVALGKRRGWWTVLDGWARLARGLILRRMLAAGRSERDMADAVRGLAPRRSLALNRAGLQGDLPGLLAASGWAATDAAQLDRAITAHLIARDRRRVRLALAVRLILPFVIAVPIGLTAASVMLMISGIQSRMINQANHPGNNGLTGGTPGMALLFWWTTRCEAQGAAATEAVREADQEFRKPPIRPVVKPKP